MKKKEKTVKVPCLSGRLPKARLGSLSQVIEQSMKQAQEIIDDPILQLGRAKHLKICDSTILLSADKSDLIWSHLVGQDYVHLAYISHRNLAKLVMLFCLKISGAYRQQGLRFPTLGGHLLNARNSELVTPLERLQFPKGLSAESPVYFVRDLRPQSCPNVIGDTLILSDNGLYRWEYRHKNVPVVWRRFPKNLKSKRRSVVIESRITSVSIEDMEKLVTSRQVVPIELLYGLRDRVFKMSNELRRLQVLSSSVLEFANGALSRISQ